MTRIFVPAPAIEADVSAEQVTAYLLARGWMPAPPQNPYWQGWHKGERVLTIPQTDCDALRTWLSENMALSIADIARAEQRHPSAVLHDIVGPAVGVAGRRCVRRIGDWFDPCFCQFLPACERHSAAHGAEESEEPR